MSELIMTYLGGTVEAPDSGQSRVGGVHTEDWEHFSEAREQLAAAFAAAGLAEVLVDTPRGQRVIISVSPY